MAMLGRRKRVEEGTHALHGRDGDRLLRIVAAQKLDGLRALRIAEDGRTGDQDIGPGLDAFTHVVRMPIPPSISSRWCGPSS